MANVIKMQTINIFPKTLRFFTISFNQANDVYVKIYETAQLTTFYVFLNQKIKIHVNFVSVLWVAFSIASSSSSLVKYPLCQDYEKTHYLKLKKRIFLPK
jgi:hypothetical protein